MVLEAAGDIALGVQNLHADTTVPKSKMCSAELTVGKATVPCIIRKIAYGNVKVLDPHKPLRVSLMVLDRLRHTAHTKKGFVNVLITTKPVQFFVYIHLDNLERVFGPFGIEMIRTGLKV